MHALKVSAKVTVWSFGLIKLISWIKWSKKKDSCSPVDYTTGA